MLLGFLEGFGLGVSEEEGERGRFDIWFVGGVVVGKGGRWTKLLAVVRKKGVFPILCLKSPQDVLGLRRCHRYDS